MSVLMTLLLDGPGAGQIFALQDERHSVEMFCSDGQSAVRYQNHRFLLDGQEYLISTVDGRNAATPDVVEKIRRAKLAPVGGA